jgi:hypothetical protein
MFNFHAWPHLSDKIKPSSEGAVAAGSGSGSLEQAVEIEEQFAITVLEGDGERRFSARATRSESRRLVAQVPEYLKPEACVRIDSHEGLVLGVAIGCWREGQATIAVFKLRHVLHGTQMAGIVRAIEELSPIACAESPFKETGLGN